MTERMLSNSFADCIEGFLAWSVLLPLNVGVGFLFLAPEENVATLRYGAQVIRGEMKTSLLDGDSQNYDLDRGFTRHPIDDNNGQGICVKLANACIVNTIKVLLWDKDMR